MSTPIKPPGGGPPRAVDAPATGPDAKDAKKDAKGSSGEFRKALDATEPARAERAAQPTAAESVRHIAERVRAGEIDATAAVEELVARALSSGAARSLTPERRRELEAVLRSALEGDPTLASLVKDLERVG